METSWQNWSGLEQLLLAISDVLVLEERPISVNELGYDGDRPLHVAATWGDVQAIEMLAAAGAEIDAIGELGCTPLYNAVSQDHAKAVQSLLRLGASPDIRSELGKTPLELARLKGLPEIVALFSNPAA